MCVCKRWKYFLNQSVRCCSLHPSCCLMWYWWAHFIGQMTISTPFHSQQYLKWSPRVSMSIICQMRLFNLWPWRGISQEEHAFISQEVRLLWAASRWRMEPRMCWFQMWRMATMMIVKLLQCCYWNHVSLGRRDCERPVNHSKSNSE